MRAYQFPDEEAHREILRRELDPLLGSAELREVMRKRQTVQRWNPLYFCRETRTPNQRSAAQ